MSIQAKRKELLNTYGATGLAVGYCDAQALLSYQNKMCYCAGVYGWNFDAYDVDGVLITTGYRNLIGRQPRFLDKYEQKARAIVNDWNISHARKVARVNRLLKNWIKKELKQC